MPTPAIQSSSSHCLFWRSVSKQHARHSTEARADAQQNPACDKCASEKRSWLERSHSHQDTSASTLAHAYARLHCARPWHPHLRLIR